MTAPRRPPRWCSYTGRSTGERETASDWGGPDETRTLSGDTSRYVGVDSLLGREPAENKAETRELGVAAEIPVGVIFIAGLVVMVRNVVFALRMAPRFIVAFEQLALIH